MKRFLRFATLFLFCTVLRTVTTINLYIATTGSDSIGSGTAGQPYATLAKALTRVPKMLDVIYQINVADGTYAEPINLMGYTAPIFDNSTGYPAALMITGDVTTPANVVFTGTCSDLGVSNGACIGNGLPVVLNGLTVNVAAAFAIACDHCVVSFKNMVVTGALSTAGIVGVGCYMYFGPGNTISGFNSSLGLGVDLNYNCTGILAEGTLTITGPGGNNTAFGLVAEFQSVFRIQAFSGTPALSVSGTQMCIQVTANSHFANYSGSSGNVSCSNSSTPSGIGYGIQAVDESGYSQSGGTLSIVNYDTCEFASGESEIDQGPGQTLTCNTATSSQQNSIIVRF